MNTLSRAKGRATRALEAFHSAVKELEEANRQLATVKESAIKEIESLRSRHDEANREHAANCDEFLQADAKARQGQALSRLLNIADGFIGQGLRVIFLITTNEKLSNIHGAVSRTGRCVANTQFGLFSREEAVAWLGSDSKDIPAQITLSDLYDRQRKTRQISLKKDDKNTKIGQYL